MEKLYQIFCIDKTWLQSTLLLNKNSFFFFFFQKRHQISSTQQGDSHEERTSASFEYLFPPIWMIYEHNFIYNLGFILVFFVCVWINHVMAICEYKIEDYRI